MKDKTPEQKARMKEVENVTRFQTHCIFRSLVPTNLMIEDLKQRCRDFYLEFPESNDVPTEVLMKIPEPDHVEEDLEKIPF